MLADFAACRRASRGRERYRETEVPTRRSLARMFALAPALCLFRPASLLAQSEDSDPFQGGDPPNVFFSPSGKPYRAKHGAPYPVIDWFKVADANADGRIDHAEFMADCAAFFKILDRNGDGVISPQEVAFYERMIAPEVLGMRVEGTNHEIIEVKPRLWRVQQGPSGAGSLSPSGAEPGDADPDAAPRAQHYDASGKGAAPYSFFDEPEPVTAADLDFHGLISKANFLKLADIHFQTLDPTGAGFLTLAQLPKTPAQRRLARGHHGGG